MKSMIKYAVAALVASEASATRCGELKMTQCTDGSCSEGCVESVIEPAGCSNEFLGNAWNTGSVGAYCDYYKATMKFYSKQEC